MKIRKNFYEKRKSDTSPLKDAIDEMLKAYKINGKMNETKIIESWEKLMGKTIASRTTELKFRYKKLYVTLNSAPLRQELSMSKSKLIELLNRDFAEKVVEDVIFL
jgi:predicted nucleic acid-binding Zn ribbon protein